jgi:transposase InsO family protein
MNGRKLKFLNVIDEYSRMALAIRVGRRCKAVDVIDTLEELLSKFPAPTHIRMDNGPEFIALALQEWCVGSGTGTEYIPQVHYGRTHSWNRSTAGLETKS